MKRASSLWSHENDYETVKYSLMAMAVVTSVAGGVGITGDCGLRIKLFIAIGKKTQCKPEGEKKRDTSRVTFQTHRK